MPPRKAAGKETPRGVAPAAGPGYWSPPATHPKFTAETRAELARILGSKAAAQRIESVCVAQEEGLQHAIDMRAFLATLEGLQDTSRELVRKMRALHGMHASSAASLCGRVPFERFAIGDPGIGEEQRLWLLTLGMVEALGDAAGSARAQWATPGKGGKPQAPLVAALGPALVAALTAHGLKRSKKEGGALVRAVAVVLHALSIESPQAHNFVESALRKGG